MPSFKVNRIPHGGQPTFFERLLDIRQLRFSIVKGDDNGIIPGHVEFDNPVHLFEDRTYPRPSSSGRTAGDGQLYGFIRRKDGLIKQQGSAE